MSDRSVSVLIMAEHSAALCSCGIVSEVRRASLGKTVFRCHLTYPPHARARGGGLLAVNRH